MWWKGRFIIIIIIIIIIINIHLVITTTCKHAAVVYLYKSKGNRPKGTAALELLHRKQPGSVFTPDLTVAYPELSTVLLHPGEITYGSRRSWRGCLHSRLDKRPYQFRVCLCRPSPGRYPPYIIPASHIPGKGPFHFPFRRSQQE